MIFISASSLSRTHFHSIWQALRFHEHYNLQLTTGSRACKVQKVAVLLKNSFTIARARHIKTTIQVVTNNMGWKTRSSEERVQRKLEKIHKTLPGNGGDGNEWETVEDPHPLQSSWLEISGRRVTKSTRHSLVFHNLLTFYVLSQLVPTTWKVSKQTELEPSFFASLKIYSRRVESTVH